MYSIVALGYTECMNDTQLQVNRTELPVRAKEIVASVPVCAGATVLALYGDLGAGKTTFVQEIANALGVSSSVQSPTFVLQKKYETQHERFTTLLHMDLYRLDTTDELAVLDLDTCFYDPRILCCIEWPELLRNDIAPACRYDCSFTIVDESVRNLTLTNLKLPRSTNASS
jgi:tRNA threonylcarbamoyladenosine biosynthesis protein TsaE